MKAKELALCIAIVSLMFISASVVSTVSGTDAVAEEQDDFQLSRYIEKIPELTPGDEFGITLMLDNENTFKAAKKAIEIIGIESLATKDAEIHNILESISTSDTLDEATKKFLGENRGTVAYGAENAAQVSLMATVTGDESSKLLSLKYVVDVKFGIERTMAIEEGAKLHGGTEDQVPKHWVELDVDICGESQLQYDVGQIPSNTKNWFKIDVTQNSGENVVKDYVGDVTHYCFNDPVEKESKASIETYFVAKIENLPTIEEIDDIIRMDDADHKVTLVADATVCIDSNGYHTYNGVTLRVPVQIGSKIADIDQMWDEAQQYWDTDVVKAIVKDFKDDHTLSQDSILAIERIFGFDGEGPWASYVNDGGSDTLLNGNKYLLLRDCLLESIRVGEREDAKWYFIHGDDTIRGTNKESVSSNFTVSASFDEVSGVTDADVIGLFEYSFHGEGSEAYVTIDRGKVLDTKLIIPSEINGVPVKKIGYRAFNNDDSVKTLVIPKTLESIEEGAFDHCSELNTIELPDGYELKNIGAIAFRACVSLTVPELTGVTIGKDAFSGTVEYRFLETVDYGDYTYKIYLEGGRNVAYLTDYIGNDINANIKIGGHDLELEDGSVLEADGYDIVVSDDVFSYYTTIASVEIKSNVIEIGNRAFYRCTGLSSLTFENGCKLTTIGESAFEDIPISELTLPTAVENIGRGAFASAVNYKGPGTEGETDVIHGVKYVCTLYMVGGNNKADVYIFIGDDLSYPEGVDHLTVPETVIVDSKEYSVINVVGLSCDSDLGDYNMFFSEGIEKSLFDVSGGMKSTGVR